MTRETGSQASLREANRRRVLQAVRLGGSPTQAQLARQTGLSPATVSNIVKALRSTGTVVVAPTSSGGRRAQSVAISRSVGVVAGIDFGHRHLRVAVCDLAHTVLAEEAMPLQVDRHAAQGLDAAEHLFDRMLSAAGVRRGDVLGVGLGLPGPIETQTGAIGSSSIMPGWVGVDAGRVLSERLGLAVNVDNDANLGALAEVAWGAARGYSDAVYIKLSTGVGAGLVIGRRLYRGRAGTAGEIGHTVIDENGPVCRCGNRGCLETFVGAPRLLELLRPSQGQGLTLRSVVVRAQAGDRGCRRVIADAGHQVGVAVANLCNLLNPGLVVVSGELAQAGDLLLDPLRATVERQAISTAAESVQIVRGVLGERAEVLGALALVLEETELPVG